MVASQPGSYPAREVHCYQVTLALLELLDPEDEGISIP